MPPKCELILALSVVLYLVRPVNKFGVRLVTDLTPNKWRPMEKDRCTDRDFVLTGYTYIFCPQGKPVDKVPYPQWQGQVILLQRLLRIAMPQLSDECLHMV